MQLWKQRKIWAGGKPRGRTTDEVKSAKSQERDRASLQRFENAKIQRYNAVQVAHGGELLGSGSIEDLKHVLVVVDLDELAVGVLNGRVILLNEDTLDKLDLVTQGSAKARTRRNGRNRIFSRWPRQDGLTPVLEPYCTIYIDYKPHGVENGGKRAWEVR